MQAALPTRGRRLACLIKAIAPLPRAGLCRSARHRWSDPKQARLLGHSHKPRLGAAFACRPTEVLEKCAPLLIPATQTVFVSRW